MATWFLKQWGWVRKGAGTLASSLGYGAGGYGNTKYGE